MDKEEIKKANITFNKGGNGGISNRVTIPGAWVKALGITKEDKEVELELTGGKIIITKK